MDLEPTTPIITDKAIREQPKTEDKFEIDLGDDEMSEDADDTEE